MAQLDLGEPFVLEPMDEPPYSSYAPVDPGQTQQTMYNNLIKAPVFQHQAAPTDFLVVRSVRLSHFSLSLCIVGGAD